MRRTILRPSSRSSRYLPGLGSLALALLLGACASTSTNPPVDERAAQPQQVAQDGTAVDRGPTSEAAAVDIDRAIDRALENGWDDLHMIVECITDDGWRAAEIFGNGVAIWNQVRQFQLPEAHLRQQLTLIRDSEFESMKELYGGNIKKEDAGGSALRVTCRVLLELDGARKQVAQRAKGEQSEALKELAARLLEISHEPAKSGVLAEDLADGLGKLANGELAPVTWRLLINRKPERVSGRDGWLLKVEDDTAVARVFEQDAGYGPAKALKLTAAELNGLFGDLLSHRFTSLPINLYAEDYTDLSVSVLNHRQKVQARQFAGMEPDQHGDKQVRFDRLVEELRQLHQRVMDTGRPTDDF